MTTTSMVELVYCEARDLAAALRDGKLSASGLCSAYQERIADLNRELGAYIAIRFESAAAAARGADERRRSGQARSDYDGVPIAFKDLLDIEGEVTQGGSKHFEGRVSTNTATLVETLASAGVYGLGKTHTVEFAMGGWGTNQHLGTPWNPWDTDTHRAPGGSSSGSGVAVAAGLAPWAIGTDTGGSVRLPSAWCGLSGLKTTVGRISTFGIVPLSTTLDTPGPICRSVEDAAHLFSLLQARDEKDVRTLIHPPADVLSTLHGGVSGMRLARLNEHELDDVETPVRQAYEESMLVLERLGANIVEIELPFGLQTVIEQTMRIIAAEGYSFYGNLIDEASLPLDDNVRPRLALGRDILAKDYLLALRDRDTLKQKFTEAMSNTRALLTPTIATTAPAIDSIDETGTPAKFTRPANLLDACALSLPNGFSDEGLPTSLQIMCRGYDEALALRIGYAFQQQTDWHKRRPAGFS